MAGLSRHASQDSRFLGALREEFGGERPSLGGIEEWVRSRFVYQPESVEILRAPQFSLIEIFRNGWFSGDCDDAAIFVAAVLRSFGYPAEFLAIRYSDPTEFEHVFVLSDSFVFDPTVPYGTEYEALERMTEAV